MEEDIALGPLQRWQRYRVFPWRLVLHILIVLACTVLVFMYNSVHGVVSVSMAQCMSVLALTSHAVFFPLSAA